MSCFFFFFFYCTKSLDISYWSDSHEVTTFERLTTYIYLVCTDWLVLSDVHISLFVPIGLLCPNKVLMLVYEWICTLQFLSFAVGLLVQSGLVSLFDVFDLRSLSTKWASHRKQIVWDIFRLWRILLCWYIKPCMLLNQVCSVCVRFGECWHWKRWNDCCRRKGDYFGDWFFALLSTSKLYSPRCLSNRVGLRDKGERSHDLPLNDEVDLLGESWNGQGLGGTDKTVIENPNSESASVGPASIGGKREHKLTERGNSYKLARDVRERRRLERNTQANCQYSNTHGTE